MPLLNPLAFFSLFSAISAVWSFGSSASFLRHAPIVDRRPPSSRRTTRGNTDAARVLCATPSFASAPWKPCAQPRFDEFASSTVGPWTIVTNAEDGAAAPTVHEVEEVMRSCGGAIQGIRELPLSSLFETTDGEDHRTYHNRADGGFVYADDGSYGAGPEAWDWNASDENGEMASEAKHLMASLAFPDRRRMWIAAELSEASAVAKCSSAERSAMHQMSPKFLELWRPVSTLDQGDEGSEDSHGTTDLNASQLRNDINWELIQRVRMPNSNQPWSLARAKWEKKIVERDEGVKEYDVSKGLGPLTGFVFVESISEKDEIFGDVGAADATNVHFLAVCSASKVARSVVRCYDATGSLKSVAFLDGSLANTGKQLM